MPTYNLIEYNDKYSKTLGSLWQYYTDEPALSDACSIDNFTGNSALFKSKQKITGQTGNDGTKDVGMMVPYNYVSNFWRTLEIPLINCEINLFLTWSVNYYIVAGTVENKVPTFAITDRKLFVSALTLSTQDNTKLL